MIKIVHCESCGRRLFMTATNCLACGFQHGSDNVDEHRRLWIEGGMPWCGAEAPTGWHPLQILAAMALRKSLERVQGRPPKESPLYSEVEIPRSSFVPRGDRDSQQDADHQSEEAAAV